MITIAVASYNHETFVVECLESILNQSCRDLELCLVDDCSSDGTYEAILKFVASPAARVRFRALHIKRNSTNRGAAFCLNQAARMGSAPIISFMNSDDFYHTDRLKLISSRHHQEDFWLCFSN